MWSRKKNKERGTSIISRGTQVDGNIQFNGRLHIDGKVIGDIFPQDEDAVLTISEFGSVMGEIHVPNLIVSGEISGNVYCSNRLELLSKARVHGNVYYHVIEMAVGAEVNGSLERGHTRVQALDDGVDDAEIVDPTDNDIIEPEINPQQEGK